MATNTYVVYNSVDGKYDTYYWDPATITSATVRAANSSNTGTTAGKKNSNRDSSRATAEGR